MKRTSTLATALAASLLLTVTGSASAATRLAVPSGGATASGSACTTNPCDLPTALSAAVEGDTVSVGGGTYTVANFVGTSKTNVDIVGAPGAAKPLIKVSGGSGQISLQGAGDKLRNVAVEGSAGSAPVILGGPLTTVSGVDVTAANGCIQVNAAGARVEDSRLTLTAESLGGSCLNGRAGAAANLTISNVQVGSTAVGSMYGFALVSLGGVNDQVDRLVVDNPVGGAVELVDGGSPSGSNTTIRRSRLSSATGASSAATLSASAPAVITDSVVTLKGTASNPGSVPAVILAGGGTLRNVTAIATRPGSHGLDVGYSTKAVSVKNSVFRGDGKDVAVISPGDLTITNSNFRGNPGTLNAASGSNQTGDPKFVDAANGNYRPAAGSPLIDAGTDDAASGTKDLDGNDRKAGSAVDIGAYEYQPPPAPQTPAQQPQQPQQPVNQGTAPANADPPADVPATPAADRVAPVLSAVAITNKKFAVASASTPVAARAKKGTVFSYALSEPSGVTLTLERVTTGRRKGKDCVAATKKNKKGRKCRRYVKAGAISRTGVLGKNSVPFSGRIGKKALKPGNYRASIVATDAAKNASPARTVAFTVVKK